MFGNDSVSAVLSIFEKLIARLEKIQCKQQASIAKAEEMIKMQEELKRSAKAESERAAMAIKKLNKFME